MVKPHTVLLEEMLALSHQLDGVCARAGDLRGELERAMVSERKRQLIDEQVVRRTPRRKTAKAARRR